MAHRTYNGTDSLPEAAKFKQFWSFKVREGTDWEGGRGGRREDAARDCPPTVLQLTAASPSHTKQQPMACSL